MIILSEHKHAVEDEVILEIFKHDEDEVIF